MNKRKLTTALFSTLLFTLVGADLAFAQIDKRPGRADNSASRQDFNNYGDYIKKNISQTIRGSGTLHLRQLLGLDRSFNGADVESITIEAQSMVNRDVRCTPPTDRPTRGTNRRDFPTRCIPNQTPPASAYLLVNGMAEGTREMIPSFMSSTTFFLSGYNNTLGMNINTLEMMIRGDVFVQSVAVKLKRFVAPQVITVRDRVGISTSGQTTLKVKQLLNLGQNYNGYSLKSVVMAASTLRGNGTAQLIINGMPVGFSQRVGMRTENVRFDVTGNSILGSGINTIQIELTGNFDVETLAVHLVEPRRF